MKAMILAAGRGSRMQPLTNETPKPLLKVGEYSLIEHLLLQLSAQGFQDIVINVAYLGHKIMEQLKDGQRYGLNIAYSIEEEGGLETGGGIFNALPLLGQDHFLVVSGDIWTDYHFSSLKTQTFNSLAHLILVNNPSWYPTGDFHLLDNRLHVSQGTRLTFANIGVYHKDLFIDCQPGFFRLAPLLYESVEQGKATGEHFKGRWENIGTPAMLDNLNQQLA